jgi:hypothetical protein
LLHKRAHPNFTLCNQCGPSPATQEAQKARVLSGMFENLDPLLEVNSSTWEMSASEFSFSQQPSRRHNHQDETLSGDGTFVSLVCMRVRACVCVCVRITVM